MGEAVPGRHSDSNAKREDAVNFEQWWEKNEPTGVHGAQTPKHIARKLWDEWQASHDNTKDMLRKEHRRAQAYRDVMKRVATLGCKKRGRCVSNRVNEDYCVVCRTVMNILFEFERTSKELLGIIFANECPMCKGIGTLEPSGKPDGLPDPECPMCKGHGRLKVDE